ncbi:MAG: hypothetical protein M1822_004285 [Bathelium mastoideum]|nr:MAG: hypothetical protein M1822_004285 [Bathelium mastoideum]
MGLWILRWTGKTKSEWDFSNVITGLLKQDWIVTAWEVLIAERHETNIESRPNFQWDRKSDGCLELLLDLQRGHCNDTAELLESSAEDRPRELVETAYRLGIATSPSQHISTPLCPNDSESMANVNINRSALSPPKPEETIYKSEQALLADYTSSEDDSCEDDSSSDEEGDDSSSSPRKTSAVPKSPGWLRQIVSPLEKQLLNSVLNEALKLRFDGISGVRSHAGSDEITNSGSSSAGGSGSEEGGRDGGNLKRGMTGDSSPKGRDDNGANKDDPNKRQKRQSRSSVGTDFSQENLACPFYKRNPDLYRDKRSCPGPGWPSVSRLKFHLYKHHVRPIQCARCWETFEEESVHTEHQRALERCPVREKKLALGFDREQEKKLRSKRRGKDIKTEEDRWRHVYRILFPDDDEASIPSPYYILFTDSKQQKADTPNSDQQFEDFDRFYKRELPRHLQTILARHLQSQPEPVKEFLTSFLDESLPECTEELYHKWQRAQSQLPSTPAMSAPEHNVSILGAPTGLPSAPSTTLHLRTDVTEARLDPFYVPPPAASNPTSLGEIRWQEPAAHGRSGWSDSAYFSSESTHGQTEQNDGNDGNDGSRSSQVGCGSSGEPPGSAASTFSSMYQPMTHHGDYTDLSGIEYVPQIAKPEQLHSAAAEIDTRSAPVPYLPMPEGSAQSQGTFGKLQEIGSFGDHDNETYNGLQAFPKFPVQYHPTNNGTQGIDALPAEAIEQQSFTLLFDQTNLFPDHNTDWLPDFDEKKGGDFSPKQ